MRQPNEITTDCAVCGDVVCERDLRIVETVAEADALDVAPGDLVCTECARDVLEREE